jgi:hypothetical protein
MIVLCDKKAIYQLLDRKGSIYSERPHLAIPVFMSRGDHMTFEPSNPSWREKRMVATRNLTPKMLDEKHFRVQEAEYVYVRPSAITLALISCYEPNKFIGQLCS